MYAFNIKVEKENKEMTMRPVMFYSKFSQGVMKSPDIAYFSYKDLYISPMSLEEPNPYPKESMYDLKKGAKTKVNELEVEFVDFDFGNMQKGGKEMGSGNYTLGAIIKVTDGAVTETMNVKTKFVDGTPQPNPVMMESSKKYAFYFLNMSVRGEEEGGTTALFSIMNSDTAPHQHGGETLVVNAAIKPFISVLWTGIVILFAGFFVSIVRRRKELLVKYPENNADKSKENNHKQKNKKK
jgi:cytochrome c biogenesis factor